MKSLRRSRDLAIKIQKNFDYFRFNYFIISYQITFNAFPAFLNASTHRVTCSSEWPALNCTLILASPLGTTGKLKPITKMFSSSIRVDS